ncbi:hypothetical protein BDR04DRAFT_1143006 [Suillus decipiens]|nr:hypothetical protein BDR04DRAFT_1143006 [Suillus decipiens]
MHPMASQTGAQPPAAMPFSQHHSSVNPASQQGIHSFSHYHHTSPQSSDTFHTQSLHMNHVMFLTPPPRPPLMLTRKPTSWNTTREVLNSTQWVSTMIWFTLSAERVRNTLITNEQGSDGHPYRWDLKTTVVVVTLTGRWEVARFHRATLGIIGRKRKAMLEVSPEVASKRPGSRGIWALICGNITKFWPSLGGKFLSTHSGGSFILLASKSWYHMRAGQPK